MSAATTARRAPVRREDPATPRRGPASLGWIALGVTAVGLIVCYVVGRRLQADGYRLFTSVPPLTGRFDPRLPLLAIVPMTIGAVLAWSGPRLASRLSWRTLLSCSALGALAWSASLAAADASEGFLDPVLRQGDYLAGLTFVDAPGPYLERFVSEISQYPTHVRAHPPGLVVGLWWLDRIGLGGGAWAATLEHAVAASAVPAVLLAVREVSTVAVARRVAPFLVLLPAAFAVGSGDAIFVGVGAWSVAALIIAATRQAGSKASIGWGIVSGLVAGLGLFLSYGLVLLGTIPLAVSVARRRFDVAALVIPGIAVVTMSFAALGFWWWDGLTATREQYASSIARSRPYPYYLFANLTAFALALGPAGVAAVPRLRDRRLWLLVGGGLASVLVADLSGLSKAEVERIWLPFAPWIAVATAIYTDDEAPGWLGAQALCALAIQLLVRTLW